MQLLPLDEEKAFFAFVDGKFLKFFFICLFINFSKGDLFERQKPYTFIHATFYRLTTGEKFGFNNRTAKKYVEQVLHTPWEPWTGETIPVIPVSFFRLSFCDSDLIEIS